MYIVRMLQLLFSGFLYLIGVAIILLIQPETMFDDQGNWKEFGIGKNTQKYTWMPFWLFAILWAITSYILVLIIFSFWTPAISTTPKEIVETAIPSAIPDESTFSQLLKKQRKKVNPELQPGYYLFNSSGKGGIPRYIYLGQSLD